VTLLGPLIRSESRSGRFENRGDLVESAVEKQTRHAGLFLDAVGERDIGRIDRAIVENDIGTSRQDFLHAGRIAASGQASEGGQRSISGRHVGALLCRQRQVPVDQLLGRKRVDKHSRRGCSREDALDLCRHLDTAPCGVGDDARLRAEHLRAANHNAERRDSVKADAPSGASVV
jgi:hypothetical protein